MWISEGPKPATRGGVNESRSKFFPKSIRRPISQNHHKPSRVLGEVWNNYGRAKPTQTSPRTSERKLGSKRENQQTWQTQTGQTAYSDRSDRSGWNWNPRPVRPVSSTGQTDRSQKARNQSFKWWISIKWSPNSMKLEGCLHIYPINISPRDLSQKIRGTREFEERSKRIGVFSRTWKTLIRGTRESWEFSPRLDGQEANHGVPIPSKRKLRSQKSPKERKSSHEQEMNGNTQELLKGDLDFIQIHHDL